jgi:hypothetical protein
MGMEQRDDLNARECGMSTIYTEGQSHIREANTGGEAVTQKFVKKNKNLRTCYAEAQRLREELKLAHYPRQKLKPSSRL